jgi:hypothetical protein
VTSFSLRHGLVPVRSMQLLCFLEGTLVREFMRHSLSILLILLSLPFLAFSFLAAALCATAVAAFPHFNRQPQSSAMDLGKSRPVDQFGFENALTAYEDLIGTHAWKRS